jgi:hypothetical protein
MTETAQKTAVSFELGEDELLGVHLLATMEGVADDDAEGFGDVLRFTLQRGIADRLNGAGMKWPPSVDAFDLAEKVGREVKEEAEEDQRTESERESERDLRRAALIAAIALASAVLIIGGYTQHWAWTGFTKNNQLWDWFHLLLLPVVFGTFPLWLRYSGYMSPSRRRALGAAIVVFVVFVVAGYLKPIGWTGFRGQTLWNWLLLIVLPLSVITVRAWPETEREFRRHHIALIAVFGIALAITLVGGYAGSWSWTGYKGNTLWDWLALVLAPIAFATVVTPSLVKLISGGVSVQAREDRKRQAREQALRAARERTELST